MSEHHHLYNRAAWKRLRVAQLRAHPLCRMHQAVGRLVPAAVVDHVTPHKGDEGLFFDADNLQSLCKPCHDGQKQREERASDRARRNARARQ
jgi:5-methylcytosine-specific restriction endonuclease McrA